MVNFNVIAVLSFVIGIAIGIAINVSWYLYFVIAFGCERFLRLYKERKFSVFFSWLNHSNTFNWLLVFGSWFYGLCRQNWLMWSEIFFYFLIQSFTFDWYGVSLTSVIWMSDIFILVSLLLPGVLLINKSVILNSSFLLVFTLLLVILENILFQQGDRFLSI